MANMVPNFVPGLPTQALDENGEPIPWDSGGAHAAAGAVGGAVGGLLAGKAGAALGTAAGLWAGPSLIPGGRSWQKIWAASLGYPDYRVTKDWRRIREYDDVLSDFLGVRYSWLGGDLGKLAKEKKDALARTSSTMTRERNDSPRSRKKLVDDREAEMLADQERYYRENLSRAKRLGYLRARAMRMVSK